MSRRYRHYKYCSRKCSYKRSIWNKGRHVKTNTGRTHFKKGQTGNKCVNWKGGISFEPYGLKFNNELKDKIRKRDGYRCQECFRHQNELFKNTKNGYKSCKLYVHHIDYDKKNCNSRNLISLCLSCHMKTNWNRSNWTKYFSK